MFRNYYNRGRISNSSMSNNRRNTSGIRDYGPEPFATDIKLATMQNENFRTALWTGGYLQVTLMCINPGECIGLETHPCTDQFLGIEQGCALVQMGNDRNSLNFQTRVHENCVIIIPAGKWHNLTNIGDVPLKLYSIYAPPNHPRGTIHRTKAEAEKMER